MITDGLGYKNRMVEDEFAISISAVITILYSSVRRIFMCVRKKFTFDSLDKKSIFVSKPRKYNT